MLPKIFYCTCARALVLTMVVGVLFSCGDSRRDIRNYYFPARELAETGQVYIYERTGSLPGPEQEYSYYLGVNQDSALYLSVTRYDGAFNPAQQTRQQIENDGVYVRDMILLQTDTTGIATRIPTTLLFKKAFPFYLDEEDASPSGYRIKFSPPGQETTETFVSLTRTYRSDTTINVLGETYDAVVFNLAGEVSERDTELGDISPQFTGYEIYAEGLGMVQYERVLANNATLGARLLERMPMPEFLEQVNGQRQ